MRITPKNVLFLIQFVFVGLGIAFLWLLLKGQLISHSGMQAQNNFQTSDIAGPITEVTQKDSNVSDVTQTITHLGHLSFASAVEIAQPAVVNIITVVENKLDLGLNNQNLQIKPGLGLGSGVIVDKQGYILTNHHVIQDVDAIAIVHTDGRAARAQIVGTDRATDLALLFVPALSEKSELATLDFANSNNLHVGDIVLAIGNQFGIGQTVTQGIVSATGRRTERLAQYEDFIQTDANISAGNSGGALINTNGELVGINTAELSREGQRSGIGFAIPSNLAKGVFEQLKKNGRVIRGWLGVGVGAIDPQYGERLGLEPNFKGSMIREVDVNSPAAKSGLRPFDIIISVNGEAIERNNDSKAMHLIAGSMPGDMIRLGIRRGNQLFEVEVIMEETPPTENN